MSLDTQLQAKADEIFKKEWQAAFSDLEKRIWALTSVDYDSATGRDPCAAAIRAVRGMRYQWEGAPNEAINALRERHRERFIASFIAKVEEAQSYLESGAA